MTWISCLLTSALLVPQGGKPPTKKPSDPAETRMFRPMPLPGAIAQQRGVRRIVVDGALGEGVYAKDVILEIIARLGVKGGVGYAYEYAGAVVEQMAMDERMTMCNMSIEGGARIGYVNPDDTTYDYLSGRPFAPEGESFERAKSWWRSMASDDGANYDDEVVIDGSAIAPRVTWGINPGQSVSVEESIPDPTKMMSSKDAAETSEALEFMGFTAGAPIAGTKIDVAFVGSCTNSRLSDIREAARVVRGHKVSSHVKALVVPGSKRPKALTWSLKRLVLNGAALDVQCALR